jgi:hypothetical protein
LELRSFIFLFLLCQRSKTNQFRGRNKLQHDCSRRLYFVACQDSRQEFYLKIKEENRRDDSMTPDFIIVEDSSKLALSDDYAGAQLLS